MPTTHTLVIQILAEVLTLRGEVLHLRSEVLTLRKEVREMDANIQAALDAQSAKIDEVTSAIVTEIDEVKTLIAAIPTTGDPTEIVTAIESANARLDQLKTAVADISTAVAPAPPTP